MKSLKHKKEQVKNKNKMKRYFDKRLLLVTLLVLFLLLVPQLVKITQGQNLFLSGDTYYNVRLIEQGKELGVFGWDSLQSRPVHFNLFHYFLAFLPLPVFFMVYFLPLVMGLLSLVLVYFLFRRFGLDEDTSVYASLIFSTIPVYIYTFTNLIPLIFGLPLVLGGTLLFLRNDFYAYFSILFFIPLIFISLPISITLILFLLILSFFIKKERVHKSISLALIFVFLATWLVSYIFDFFALKIIPSVASFDNLLLEFGSVSSYSIITIGLSLIGLASWWKRDIKNNLVILGFLAFMFFSVFYNDLIIISSIFVAFMSGIAINTLINREWELVDLKEFTLLLVLCIVIFSTIVLLNNEISFIDNKEYDAIQYLSVSDPNDVVLSVESKGFLIQQISNRKTFIDSNSWQYYDYDERLDVMNNIFYSRNLKELEQLLLENKITHIFVNEDMRNGLVWVGREEGLLLFLDNTDMFVKLYDDGSNQVYRYVLKR